MRILLVEDDTGLQTSLAEILREAGYAVDVTGDGIEGLFFGEEYPIDLAIIDLGLPGLPGLDLIRKLRELERQFPILILTARSEWQDKGRTQSACWCPVTSFGWPHNTGY